MIQAALLDDAPGSHPDDQACQAKAQKPIWGAAWGNMQECCMIHLVICLKSCRTFRSLKKALKAVKLQAEETEFVSQQTKAELESQASELSNALNVADLRSKELQASIDTKTSELKRTETNRN